MLRCGGLRRASEGGVQWSICYHTSFLSASRYVSTICTLYDMCPIIWAALSDGGGTCFVLYALFVLSMSEEASCTSRALHAISYISLPRGGGAAMHPGTRTHACAHALMHIMLSLNKHMHSGTLVNVLFLSSPGSTSCKSIRRLHHLGFNWVVIGVQVGCHWVRPGRDSIAWTVHRQVVD